LKPCGRYALVAVIGLAVLLGVAACDSGGGDEPAGQTVPYECGPKPCDLSNYLPDLPAGEITYVNVCCEAGSPDGSSGAPYESISAALEGGATGLIAVAAGTYTDNVVITSAVTVLGPGTDRAKLAATGDGPALTVKDCTDVAVSGLLVAGSGNTGIVLASAENVEISSVTAIDHAAEGGSGYGLRVDDCTNVTLTNVACNGNGTFGIASTGSTGTIVAATATDNGCGSGSAGILLAGGSDFAIGSLTAALPGDLATDGVVLSQNNGTGLLVWESRVTLAGASLEENLHSGIAFVDAFNELSPSLVEGNMLSNNQGVAIGIFGGNVVLKGNQIAGSGNCEGTCVGYGIAVVGDTPDETGVVLEDNDIQGSTGSGVLLHGISTITASRNNISGAEMGGIWAQGGVNLETCEENTIADTKMAGISITADSNADLVGNEIVGTTWGEKYDFKLAETVKMADGIVLSDIAASTGINLSGNRVVSSLRAGIIVDGSSADLIQFGEGNVVAGNLDAGIALQNGSETILDDQNLGNKVAFQEAGLEANGGKGNLASGTGYQLAKTMDQPSTALCAPPECTE
jgi:hypothetical protein